MQADGGEGRCSQIGEGEGDAGPIMTTEDVRVGEAIAAAVVVCLNTRASLWALRTRLTCGRGGNAAGVGGDGEQRR